MNEDIKAVPKVRLIGVDGNQVGVIDSADALSKADDANLDLVEIVPNADPPVCRIMDYGKYVFNQSKKQQASKKKQKQIQVKEIKIRPGTERGDYNVKLANLAKFLQSGNKVKITLRFRGREMVHQELGIKMLERIKEDLKLIAEVEQEPKMQGRQMTMVMSLKK